MPRDSPAGRPRPPPFPALLAATLAQRSRRAGALQVLLSVAHPRTTSLSKVPGSAAAYRMMDQYATAQATPGVLVLRIDAPIYFANTSYLWERVSSDEMV